MTPSRNVIRKRSGHVAAHAFACAICPSLESTSDPSSGVSHGRKRSAVNPVTKDRTPENSGYCCGAYSTLVGILKRGDSNETHNLTRTFGRQVQPHDSGKPQSHVFHGVAEEVHIGEVSDINGNLGDCCFIGSYTTRNMSIKRVRYGSTGSGAVRVECREYAEMIKKWQETSAFQSEDHWECQ